MDDEKDQLLQHAAIQRAGTKTSSALLLRMVQDQVIRPAAFCFFSFEASCTWVATIVGKLATQKQGESCSAPRWGSSALSDADSEACPARIMKPLLSALPRSADKRHSRNMPGTPPTD